MYTGLKNAVGAGIAMAILIIGFAVIVTGITVGIVEIHAAISKTTGDAKVKSDTNDGTNQEAASAIFAQLIAQIQSDQAKMTTDVQIGNMTAAALVNSDCITAVGQYNSDAKTDTLAPNLPAGDPTSYDAAATCAIPAK